MGNVIKITLYIIFIGSAYIGRSQFAIAYDPFQSRLSLSSNPENRVWGNLAVETNTFFTNVNMESSLQLNLVSKIHYTFYSGIGYNFNPSYKSEILPFTNGYSVNIAIRMKPLKESSQVQIILELSPYSNKNFDGGLLRTFLAISYVFNH